MQQIDTATVQDADSNAGQRPLAYPDHVSAIEFMRGALARRQRALAAVVRDLDAQAGTLGVIADPVAAALLRGGKALVAGNGGSAAEAQHFAGELVGRFKLDRAPYAALALTADSAILTAIGNDYGYAEVFARQLRALGRPGDVFVALSTSGGSENLLRAAATARDMGILVVAATGARPSALAAAADLSVRVAATDTAIIQEAHMLVTHLLCEFVERCLVAPREVDA